LLQGAVGFRAFSSAGGKLTKVLLAEIKHEVDQYEQPQEIKNFLKSCPFELVDAVGDVNMSLKREVGGKIVQIEWQLSSPFDPDMDPNAQDGGDVEQQETEITVTVQDKSGGAGLLFYCSTQPGEDHRYVIGNVRSFNSTEEKESVSAYNGPEFEDLDDKLQEGFDEYLAELGMSPELCDFVDGMAQDKEQREYVHWLKTVQKFVE